MAGVTLTLLGPPSVLLADEGTGAPLLGAKDLALLSYLALEPGPHTREELAGLLWGESSDASHQSPAATEN